jgi:predicted DNA-binding protein YlxM (UPF0122 family)
MAKRCSEQWRINCANSNRAKGEELPQTKLKEEQVLEIVKLFQNENFSLNELATIFHVSKSCIMKIVTGRSWTQITGIKQKGRKYKN